ncbi:MAG: hypothetical protein HY959_02860 [Ignavibacteriae bacterium]|nr:hypothetical protein [Ignavibacteriota bacterium]
MKKILYLSVIALALFSSCQNNPVIVEENKINMTNSWTPVYSVTSLHTYSGDVIGKNFSLGYGNFSNCTMVRIKIKYKSTYQKWCLPPSLYVAGCGAAYLRSDVYSTFDSIFKLAPNDSIREIGGFVKNGKLQFDTLIIMKGYPNFDQ